MFFAISKVAGFFLTPSNCLVLLSAAAALALLAGRRRTGAVFAVLAGLGLVIFGFSPAANLLLRPLENRFPAVATESLERVDGIVVLGGSAQLVRGQARLGEAGARITATLALARRFPQARIVFSGGDGRLVPVPGESEADAVRLLLRQTGADDARVVIEDSSRNTRENAAYSRALARPRPHERWLLVTSASHMPRAVAAFRHEDFAVTPFPVDFVTTGTARDLLPFAEAARGLRLTDRAAHEWVGLLAYWLAGYTPELVPGPDAEGD
ncbi:YdcF family protein [Camelimonas abortus]|uniref:YdcF family protein n=1 Tax=Camelimonas abortus TaxID=1017184 RepID=A0ABV7LET0_9HYPH